MDTAAGATADSQPVPQDVPTTEAITQEATPVPALAEETKHIVKEEIESLPSQGIVPTLESNVSDFKSDMVSVDQTQPPYGSASPKKDENEELANYVRLRGLPFSASDDDVKKFLTGVEVLSIQVVGGRDGRPSGECYVELPSAQDVDKAMEFHMKEMESRYVEVFTVTESEMNTRRTSMVDDGTIVRLRGLPYEATKEDVEQFLNGLDCAEVVFGTMGGGRPSGEVYVRLATKEQASKAMEFNRQLMGKRYIEVFRSNPDEMEHGRNPAKRERRDRGDRSRRRDRDRERDRSRRSGVRRDRPEDFGRSGRGPPQGYRPYDVPSRSDYGRGYEGGYEDYYAPRDPYYGDRRAEAPGYGAYAGAYGADPYYDAYQGGYGRGYGDPYAEGYGSYGGGYEGAGAYGMPRGAGGYGMPREPAYGYPDAGRNRRSGGGRGGAGGPGGRRGRDSERGLRVYMRGVPYDVDSSEIMEFFNPIPCVTISVGQNAEGRASGDAAVDFGSVQDLDEALKRNKLHMGKRYVELFTSNDLPGPLRRLTWKPLTGAGVSAASAATAHPYSYGSENRTGIPSLLDADPYAAAYGGRAVEPTAGAYPAAYGHAATGAEYAGYAAPSRATSGYY